MIIELENYNSAEELSIEKGNTTSLGLIRHRDMGPDSKRTMVAVRMKGKRVATRMRDRAGYMRLPIGNNRAWAQWSCRAGGASAKRSVLIE